MASYITFFLKRGEEIVHSQDLPVNELTATMLRQAQQSHPEAISVDAWMSDDNNISESQQTQVTEINTTTNHNSPPSSLSASADGDKTPEPWGHVAPIRCENCAQNNVECLLVPLDAPKQNKSCFNCQNCKDWLPHCSFDPSAVAINEEEWKKEIIDEEVEAAIAAHTERITGILSRSNRPSRAAATAAAAAISDSAAPTRIPVTTSISPISGKSSRQPAKLKLDVGKSDTSKTSKAVNLSRDKSKAEAAEASIEPKRVASEAVWAEEVRASGKPAPAPCEYCAARNKSCIVKSDKSTLRTRRCLVCLISKKACSLAPKKAKKAKET